MLNPWFQKALDAAEIGENLPLAVRLALAALLVLVAYLVRLWAWPVMQATIPYVTFFPAVILSVFFLGRIPGITTAVLSFFVCWYYLLPTLNSWSIGFAYGSVALSFFIFAAGVNIFLIETIKAAVKQIEVKNEESKLLAREINHRVKNLFAVVRSLIKLSGRNETDAQSIVAKISGRIDALAVSHNISQGYLGTTEPTFKEISRVILNPYNDNRVININGGGFEIDRTQVTPFGLILHELATNAVKYGALSIDDGTLDLNITRSQDDESQIDVVWNEMTKQDAEEKRNGGAAAATSPDLSGFGSVLIEQSVKQLGGNLERTWSPDGLLVKFGFPASN